MSDTISIAVLAPQVFNPNGDAENGRVLVRRLLWSGLDAQSVDVVHPREADQRFDAFVIGSCPESEVMSAHGVLSLWREIFAEHLADDRPILAIGTGAELLSERIELRAGEIVDGLGLLPTRATLLPQRAVGEIAVSTSLATLSGYENHARGFSGTFEPLGEVLSGVGNGDGTEGVRAGTLLATHLHGPVAAKNPVIADEILAKIAANRGAMYTPNSAAAEKADGYARDAHEAVMSRLRLSSH